MTPCGARHDPHLSVAYPPQGAQQRPPGALGVPSALLPLGLQDDLHGIPEHPGVHRGNRIRTSRRCPAQPVWEPAVRPHGPHLPAMHPRGDQRGLPDTHRVHGKVFLYLLHTSAHSRGLPSIACSALVGGPAQSTSLCGVPAARRPAVPPGAPGVPSALLPLGRQVDLHGVPEHPRVPRGNRI